jgi:hypothetical protein
MKTRCILRLFSLAVLLQLVSCKKSDDVTLLVNPTNITFGYTEDQATVYISNAGSPEISWTVSSSSDFIDFSKRSGSCSKNVPDKFNILLKRELIHQDSLHASVTITPSSGDPSTISLFIHGYPENKIRVNATIYDADYDYTHDRLVMITYSNGINQVEMYDLAQNKFTTIPVITGLSRIAVSPDGTYALASSSSNNLFVQVDLVQNTVVNSFYGQSYSIEPIPCNNKSVYYFPYYDNSSLIRLDLLTGNTQTYDLGTYQYFAEACLHPSGRYIYAGGNSVLSKISIIEDTPQLLYYTSNYYIESNLWLMRDGTHIFTDNRKILTIDPGLAGNDIVHDDNLTLPTEYVHLAGQSTVRNEYYVVGSNSYYSEDENCSRIYVFNSSYSQTGSISLEKYYLYYSSSSQSYFTANALADFLFVSSDGSKIIVISHPENYYSDYGSGIEIINRSKR